MSTQVINFADTENVVFNGQPVETLILNGVEIWTLNTFKNLDKLIDRSIESVSAEYLDGVVEIGSYAFYGCEKLTNVTIPLSVTNIGISSFYGCVSLPEIFIPESVTEIGNSAFYNCSSLKDITIGRNVNYIYYSAFQGCSSLTTIKLLPTIPPTLGASVFDGTAITRIEVPYDSLSAYKNADNWSSYASLMVGV